MMNDNEVDALTAEERRERDEREHFFRERDREEEEFRDVLISLKEYNSVTDLGLSGHYDFMDNITGEEWEEIGRDISNNTLLGNIYFEAHVLCDGGMSSLFRGLTRSSSIRSMIFDSEAAIGPNEIRSMMPFLQNATSLMNLNFYCTYVTPEGFSLLLRALRDSSLQKLTFHSCGFGSNEIQIDEDCTPNNLRILYFRDNEKINADGCHQIAKLLRSENATLEELHLENNQIGCEGISILLNALQTNSSLKLLDLHRNEPNDYANEGIGLVGMKVVLKLMNDISSIESTLQSNHTLQCITFKEKFAPVLTLTYEEGRIMGEISRMLEINKRKHYSSAEAGKEKVIRTQLDSKERAAWCHLQGVQHSDKPLTKLGPLLLPEALALVSKHHGLSEFYGSFRTSVADLWTTINREIVLEQKIEEISKELDVLEAKRLELEKQRAAFGTEIATIRQESLAVAVSSKRQRMG